MKVWDPEEDRVIRTADVRVFEDALPPQPPPQPPQHIGQPGQIGQSRQPAQSDQSNQITLSEPDSTLPPESDETPFKDEPQEIARRLATNLTCAVLPS